MGSIKGPTDPSSNTNELSSTNPANVTTIPKQVKGAHHHGPRVNQPDDDDRDAYLGLTSASNRYTGGVVQVKGVGGNDDTLTSLAATSIDAHPSSSTTTTPLLNVGADDPNFSAELEKNLDPETQSLWQELGAFITLLQNFLNALLKLVKDQTTPTNTATTMATTVAANDVTALPADAGQIGDPYFLAGFAGIAKERPGYLQQGLRAALARDPESKLVEQDLSRDPPEDKYADADVEAARVAGTLQLAADGTPLVPVLNEDGSPKVDATGVPLYTTPETYEARFYLPDAHGELQEQWQKVTAAEVAKATGVDVSATRDTTKPQPAGLRLALYAQAFTDLTQAAGEEAAGASSRLSGYQNMESAQKSLAVYEALMGKKGELTLVNNSGAVTANTPATTTKAAITTEDELWSYLERANKAGDPTAAAASDYGENVVVGISTGGDPTSADSVALANGTELLNNQAYTVLSAFIDPATQAKKVTLYNPQDTSNGGFVTVPLADLLAVSSFVLTGTQPTTMSTPAVVGSSLPTFTAASLQQKYGIGR